MIRRPPRSTQSRSSAASDVYKRQTPEVMNDMLDFIGRYRILMSGFNILRVAHIINGLGIFGFALTGKMTERRSKRIPNQSFAVVNSFSKKE